MVAPSGETQAQEVSAKQAIPRTATLRQRRASPRRTASGRRVDSSQLTFDRGYIALAKSPLSALFEGRDNIATRKFVHRVRAQVEQERDFAGVQQYVVFIGHASPTRRLTLKDFVGTRLCNMCPTPKSRRSVPDRRKVAHNPADCLLQTTRLNTNKGH